MCPTILMYYCTNVFQEKFLNFERSLVQANFLLMWVKECCLYLFIPEHIKIGTICIEKVSMRKKTGKFSFFEPLHFCLRFSRFFLLT